MPKLWKDMSEAERRVRVARDVILWLDEGRFRGVRRAQGYVMNDSGSARFPPPSSSPFRPQLARDTAANCVVCARGALLLARIGEHGGVKMNVLENSGVHMRVGWVSKSSTIRGLKDCFSREMLDEIEGYFERYKSTESWDSVYHEYGDEDVLRIIMQNIIDHRGNFEPSVEYEMV